MNSLLWWRSWHGAPTDHKWAVVAARAGSKPGIVSALAWALLDYASQQKERGTIGGFDAETYSVYSGFPEAEIIAIIQAMTDKGVIVNGKFAKWDERQPKREDDSAPRVAKFRDKNKSVTQGNADVTQGNESGESVTLVSVSPSVSVSLSNSVSNDEVEEEDTFDKIQRELEKNGIVPNNVNGINAINEIVEMGATVEDVRNGIIWLSGVKRGKTMYPSQVVNPTKTSMQKRLQSGNGHKPARPASEVFAEVYE